MEELRSSQLPTVSASITDPDARQSDSEVYEIRDTCDIHMIHDSVTHKYLCVISISSIFWLPFSL